MKKKMLKKLFRGELVPLEGRHIETPQIIELNDKIIVDREYFQRHLGDEDNIRLEAYIDKLLDRSSLESEELQFDAFVLGIQMGLEIRENTATTIRF